MANFTEDLFQQLMERGECDYVDYKESYFARDSNGKLTEDAKISFIKDVLAFANTVRETSAYIIIGAKEDPITKKGIPSSNPIDILDDSQFSDIIRSNTSPCPKIILHGHTSQYKDTKPNNYLIIEIPIKYYPEPCVCITDFKESRLEEYAIYKRYASNNNKADLDEVVEIELWLEGMATVPTHEKVQSYLNTLSNEIKPLSGTDKPLPLRIVDDKKNEVPINSDYLKINKKLLLLGDAGAGKSFTLQQICQSLCKFAENKHLQDIQIPVYLDLKYFNKLSKESNGRKIKSQIVEILKDSDFLLTHFNYFYDKGQITFIVDSFDEMPTILDAVMPSSKSRVKSSIEIISEKLINFFGSGGKGNTLLMASREFKQPNSALFDKKLNLIPLTEDIVIERLTKTGDSGIAEKLFNQPNLIPLLLNPFSLFFILHYVKISNGKIPENQLDLYQTVIEEDIKAVISENENIAISVNTVLEESLAIAQKIYNAKVPELGYKATELNAYKNTISILEKAGLTRNTKERFTFRHKKIYDFLLAKRFISHPNTLPLIDIVNLGKGRDALVVYCEVADVASAKKIAEKCWEEIKKISNYNEDTNEYKNTLAYLRFLTAAFLSRKQDVLIGIQEEIYVFIETELKRSTNIMHKKHIAELTILLDQDFLEKTLQNIILDNYIFTNYPEPWIIETAIESIKYVPKVDEKLLKNICEYYQTEFIHIFGIRYLNPQIHTLITIYKIYNPKLQQVVKTLENIIKYKTILLFYICVSFLISIYFLVIYFNILNIGIIGGIIINIIVIIGLYLYSFTPRFSKKISKLLILPSFIISIICSILCLTLVHFATKPDENHSILNIINNKPISVPPIIFISIIAITIILTRIISGKSMYYSIHDEFIFYKMRIYLKENPKLDREFIQSTLEKFKLPTSRNLFIDDLKKHKINKESKWKNNTRPNWGDDASNELAKLDEEWQNLTK